VLARVKAPGRGGGMEEKHNMGSGGRVGEHRARATRAGVGHGQGHDT
jgi:hypothetical protein